MSTKLFVNRKEEIESIEKRYRSRTPEFIVMLGRRRVGKTELCLKILESKKGIYFLASTEGTRQNMADFAVRAGRLIGDENFGKAEYTGWYSLFAALFNHTGFNKIIEKEKIIIIIDEFPFLIHSDKSTPSVFQKTWEEIMKKKNVMLILSGSAISIMESEVLGYNSPLYGRRTAQFYLQPLDFAHLKEFLPYKIQDLMQVWFVAGGIPEYILKFSPRMSFWENIGEFLKKDAYLYREAEFLLNAEFREPKNYRLIFKSIALGHTTLGEICNYTGLDKSMVSKYLDTASNLHIIAEEVPPTASSKFKKRHYLLKDSYFNFWFRYIYPNRIELEAGMDKEILELVKHDFSQYAGRMFEVLIEDLVRKKYVPGQFSFSRIGRWWYRENEIDIVAVNEETKEILFCECKWKDNVNPKKILYDLKEKAQQVRWNNGMRKEHYAIFAKSFKEKIKEPNLMLFDLDGMDAFL